MDMTEHIYPELLFIMPFLNVLGWWIKHKTKIKNNNIPAILSVVSFVLCFMYIYSTSAKSIGICLCESVVQGVFLAATAVYANQLLKTNKSDETKK